MVPNLSNYFSPTCSSSSSSLRVFALYGFLQLMPPSHLQNVEHVRLVTGSVSRFAQVF